MTAIDVEIKGLKQLQAKTDKMIRDIHGAPMLNAMRDSTMTITRKARQNAPVDTGRLRASILPEIRSSQNDILGVVGTNVIYAPDVEYGTKPHGIWTKNPFGVLAFRWENGPDGDRVYFFHHVTHPGTKGRFYLRDAFTSSEIAIQRRFDRAIKEIVE